MKKDLITRLNPAVKRYIKEQAIEIIKEFGIDTDQYDISVHKETTYTCCCFFRHKKTKEIIKISAIWTDENGKILQRGSNRGVLTL